MDHQKKVVRKLNPIEKANFLSVITFTYTLGLIKKCYKKDIEEKDIYDTVPAFSSKYLGDKLEKIWIRENVEKKTTISKVLLKRFGPGYFTLGLVQLGMRTFSLILLPKAIGRFIAYFVPNQTELSFSDACYYGFVVIGVNAFNCIYIHNYMQYVTEFAMRVRISVTSLLYRKALNLNSTSLSQVSVGKIVTLITKDVFAFDSSLIFLNDIWIGVIQIIVFAYVVYVRIGPSVFGVLLFFVFIIPVQIYLGKKTVSMRIKTAKETDERIQVTQETLNAIKIIKMYTWEPFFENHVREARRNEINKLKKIYYTKTMNMVIGGLIQNVSFYILAMSYLWMNNNFTAELAFFLISSLHSLRTFLTVSIPLGISQGAEMLASLNRIQTFLDAEEACDVENIQPYSLKQKPRILMKNVSVSAINGDKILKNISMDIKAGHMMVVGPVGSGKSMLLKTILKDNDICEGILEVQGRISYAPQEPWLFPSTIRQNITFGLKYDQTRYENVLKVCGLVHDVKQFENGDLTVVGVNAINLSKGQQARISLARAVYRESDIYLFDDCLSALDTTVANAVFKECIQGFLGDKLVVMVSNNVNHIKAIPNRFVLEKGESHDELSNKLNKRITYYMDDDDDDFNDFDYYCENESIESEEHNTLLKSTLNRNIYEEQKQTGQVEWNVYFRYFKYCGGILGLIFVPALFILTQYTQVRTEQLVTAWSNSEQKITSLKIENKTGTTEYDALVKQDNELITAYSGVIVIWSVLSLIRALFFFYLTSTASRKLHDKMASSIIKSKMEFFDNHLVGNILNRFSKDLSSTDEYIPFLLFEILRLVLIVAGVFYLIISVNRYFTFVIIFIMVLFVIIRKIYIPTGRSLKRLDASTRSPMIGYLSSTLSGLTTIRAYNTQNILRKEFDKHHDLFTSTYYMMQCTARTFGFILDTFCAMFIAFIVLFFLFIQKSENAGNAGLALNQAFALTGILQWAIRQFAELEAQMTSIERILEYTNIKTENTAGLMPANWPTEGRVCFKNVDLSYNASGEVLKNVSFEIEPKELVGIVGRTGAGKSSIISTLFRLYPAEGKFTIDGVDLKTLNLRYLRSKIAIIPQDPVLFSGTLRQNIDPIKQFSDEEIWKVIKSVKLDGLIKSLDSNITECGANFSTGEKQLICLARALVSKNKVIVLDEATANMDEETDNLIQTIIKEYFKDCTIIFVAHKLNHILKCHKVMVVEDGRIVEIGPPEHLMDDPDSQFYKMVRRAGL